MQPKQATVRNQLFSAALVAAAITAAPDSQACERQSGAVRGALLELYTSEGCDSCPPADRWVATLRKRGFASNQVIPLALHVDYWNDLGWVDPFAQAVFSARQREFARRLNARTVYTPALLLNGREYTHWQSADLKTELERINRQPPRADIRLRLDADARTLRASGEVKPRPDVVGAALYLALYENNLKSDVRAGENRGHTLEHQFVVRHLLGPLTLGTVSTRFDERFTLAATWKRADLGVAAFVQESRGTDVLQALALDLCQTATKKNP